MSTRLSTEAAKEMSNDEILNLVITTLRARYGDSAVDVVAMLWLLEGSDDAARRALRDLTALADEFVASPKLHRYGSGQWECLFCHEAVTVENRPTDHADDCLWVRAASMAAAARAVLSENPKEGK